MYNIGLEDILNFYLFSYINHEKDSLLKLPCFLLLIKFQWNIYKVIIKEEKMKVCFVGIAE